MPTTRDPEAAAPSAPMLLQLAQMLLEESRLRDAALDPAMFGSPGWDLLLKLYVDGFDGRLVTPLDACATVPLPQATTLRWLSYLAEQEWVIESADPDLRGSTLLRLSATGRHTIGTLLATMQRRRRETADAA